ncbi:MAG: hypothetical protein PVH29_06025 [Candidatus Zixiibacteriota bacterium]|jgi:hypothetical protein
MRWAVSFAVVCGLILAAASPGTAATSSDEKTNTAVYIGAGVVVVAYGIYWLATDAFEEKDPHYKSLKEEVKASETNGQGDIETQTRVLLDEAVRLEGEINALEGINVGLAARASKAKEVAEFWERLVREDEDYARNWETEKRRRAAAAGAGPTVYITRTGSKYHRSGCRYLRKSCIPIGKRNAQAQGYSP